MHESYFSHQISKPYPYRWFTWVVMIGGVIATVALSMINITASGYIVKIEYKTDPNATEHPNTTLWYQQRPWSLASKITPSCSDQLINVGSPFYTNNFGFSYSITNLYKPPDTSTPDAAPLPIAAVPYHNDFLRDCAIEFLSFIGNISADDTQCSLKLSVDINCTVYSGTGSTSFIVATTSTTADSNGIIGETLSGMPQFLEPNDKIQPGLYWGRSMINRYITGLCDNALSPYQVRGLVGSIRTNFTSDGDLQEYTTSSVVRSFDLTDQEDNLVQISWADYDVQPIDMWMSTPILDILEQGNFTGTNFSADGSSSTSYNITSPTNPMFLPTLFMDDLSKYIYATALTDLGQSQDNILGNGQQFTQAAMSSIQLFRMLHVDDPLEVDNHVIQMVTPNLANPGGLPDVVHSLNSSQIGVTMTTIATQYLCQVPKLKPAGSLIVSVLVADLVFLQTLWTILNWLTTWILERRDPSARYCAGCELMVARLGNDYDKVDGDLESNEGGDDVSVADPASTSQSLRHDRCHIVDELPDAQGYSQLHEEVAIPRLGGNLLH